MISITGHISYFTKDSNILYQGAMKMMNTFYRELVIDHIIEFMQ